MGGEGGEGVEGGESGERGQRQNLRMLWKFLQSFPHLLIYLDGGREFRFFYSDASLYRNRRNLHIRLIKWKVEGIMEDMWLIKWKVNGMEVDMRLIKWKVQGMEVHMRLIIWKAEGIEEDVRS